MRIPAQIISGIGFIGAGSITIHSNKKEALNTAATLKKIPSNRYCDDDI